MPRSLGVAPIALALLAGLTAACGSKESTPPAAPVGQPTQIYRVAPEADPVPRRASSFSRAVDESIRRQRLVRELDEVTRRSDP